MEKNAKKEILEGVPGLGGVCSWGVGGVPGPGVCTWSEGMYPSMH